jgi:SagB-type dehydrogenase family enzyme
VRSSHSLDWANQPRPYKLYQDRDPPPVRLPRDFPPSNTTTLSAISTRDSAAEQARRPDLPTVGSILHHSVGITKRLHYPGGVIDFRAAACTGALYHIELYLVCGPLPDLEAGVYHLSVPDFALRRLRAGDLRGVLVEATDQEPAVAHASAVLVCTSTYWRNSWKYQERTYRHCFWDLGTCLANLLAMAVAHRLPARVVLGFVDRDINRLVDVDGERETALALIPLGHSPEAVPAAAGTVEPLSLATLPVSPREVDYPAIRAMHSASSLEKPQDVAKWRASAQSARQPLPQSAGAAASPIVKRALQALPASLPDGFPSGSVEEVIRKRGSSRRFQPAPIGLADLGTLLHHAKQGIPADFLGGSGLKLNSTYLIVNAVDGLASGSYAFDADEHSLEPLKQGEFRREAGALALTQQLAADAAVNIYFLADLASVLDRLGNRGYRAAQLEASITAGKLYLAAYALGLGASGLTFFDDDVTAFFAPHAASKSVMFLIAIGRPMPRRAAGLAPS